MKKFTAVLVCFLLIFSVALPINLSTSAEDGVALPGLYKAENYRTHGNTNYSVEFNEEKKYIKSSNNQTKSMINYSQDMTAFDASLIIQGSSTGNIYGGVAFHIQESDFENGTFNTPGYSVIVTRSKSTLNTAKVLIRYCFGSTTKESKELTAFSVGSLPSDTDLKLLISLSVTESDFTVKLLSEDGKTLYGNKTYPLDNTDEYPSTKLYSSGAFAIITNGVHTFSEISVISYGDMKNIPKEEEEENNPSSMYDIYGTVTTDSGDYTTATSSIARGILKTTKESPVADFSADMTFKINPSGALKAGMVFRVGEAGSGTDEMSGYSLIIQKMSAGKLRLYLYKYGNNGEDLGYLGRIAYLEDTSVLAAYTASDTADAGKELTVHLNVVGDQIRAYFFDTDKPSLKSGVLSASLKTATDRENNGTVHTGGLYFDKGAVGFYTAKGSLVKAGSFKVGAAEKIDDPKEQYPGGTAATDRQKGSAVRGGAAVLAEVGGSNISSPDISSLAEYAADFDNYTFYSSSTSSSFLRTDDGIISDTTGTKRAILDGVTVKGFHASASMRIGSEGTLKSGIVFRVNNIEKALKKDGTLGANDIEGYSAVLYKTPGTSGTHARVVLLIYKFGIKNGDYMYLGTVASKESEIPLQGFENNIFAAAGQSLTLDINVAGDQVTAYFYNTDKPSLKSEALSADLNDETDIESSTPSLKGVHYSSGAIGLTASNYVTFTDFTVEEPVYPSNEVGDLSQLESYTVYGSGVTKEGDYFVANSSGTKKMIVNNLTVSDFKASVDMTIDDNGNLKAGFFFRVNDIGNGADAQTGWAIAVSRNYSSLGDTNPNRIDIVLFKWGYVNGKLSYLGEVSREAFKSGATFMDGKMAGEELTFVVSVKGAAIDATLYKKSDKSNKPATFSANLKFAAGKEKNGAVYYESGAIGLYLGNSVSDPLNTTKLRNFHIDDGSGVEVKVSALGKLASAFGLSPTTGEGMVVLLAGAVLLISAVSAVWFGILEKTGQKRENRR